MKYRIFGNTGLRVSELALGTMTFGEAWNWGASREESIRILDLFLDRGGNFVDTANVYTNGQSEEFLGAAMGDRRGRIVLSTKFTLSRENGNPNAAGSHRKNLVESLEGSLRRLGTDCIDIYWVHIRDALTPAEETLRALDDAVRAGKILYVGISDAPAWWIARANTLAAWRDWSAFAGIQIHYNLIERTSERELIPMAEALDLAVCVWSPLAGGALTGKYLPKTGGSPGADTGGTRYEVVAGLGDLLHVNSERSVRIIETVGRIAEGAGRRPHQVALSWLRQRPFAVPVIPILGARSTTQLAENLAVLDFRLSNEEIAELDAVSAIEPGFPHDFAAGVRAVAYGDRADDIRPHRAHTA